MHSAADNVADYLASLPTDRRIAIQAVRDVVIANLPAGIEETMNWGMISYEVPLDIVSDTYNGQPLSYAGLASQKNHMAIYLSGIYGDAALRDEFQDRYRQSGLRMDMGKSCVRFKKLENLPLDVIGWAAGALTLEQFIAMHAQARSMRVQNASRRH